MRKVIPTVFGARNKEDFEKKLSRIVKLSKEIQVDFMDGRFVPNRSVRIMNVPKLQKYKKNFEAHLMMYDPERFLDLLKEKGFKKIIFHFEAVKAHEKIKRLVTEIHYRRMKAWIAFNPKTSFDQILKYKDLADGVMLMGHLPGKEGLPMNLNTYRKIMNLKNEDKKLKVQVDGAVNGQTIKKLANSGADIVNVGSYVSKSRDPKAALNNLKKEFK